jgi:hypothetical protein
MKRFLKNVAAAALVGLVTVGAAQASGKGGSGGSGGGRSTGMSSSFKGGSGGSGPRSSGSSGSFHTTSGNFKSGSFNYHQSYGTKFSHGWFYQGKNHSHWTSWCWNSSWGCYNYWCPSTCCWYYWYEPTCCYYPVSYISTCTPTAYSAPQYVPASSAPVINIQNSAANGGGVAANNTPVGGPAGPAGPGPMPAPRP